MVGEDFNVIGVEKGETVFKWQWVLWEGVFTDASIVNLDIHFVDH